VNSVHTYCGLEIAIMAMTPRMSWFQRFKYQAAPTVGTATVMVCLPDPHSRQRKA